MFRTGNHGCSTSLPRVTMKQQGGSSHSSWSFSWLLDGGKIPWDFPWKYPYHFPMKSPWILIGGWATPSKNMKVRLDHHPNYWGKKCSKPPTRITVNRHCLLLKCPYHLNHHVPCSQSYNIPMISPLSPKLCLRGGTRKVGDQEGETKPLCVKIGRV